MRRMRYALTVPAWRVVGSNPIAATARHRTTATTDSVAAGSESEDEAPLEEVFYIFYVKKYSEQRNIWIAASTSDLLFSLDRVSSQDLISV